VCVAPARSSRSPHLHALTHYKAPLCLCIAVSQAKWWLRLRDAPGAWVGGGAAAHACICLCAHPPDVASPSPPELAVLGGLVGGVIVLAAYTIKKTLLNNEAGS
jgi:hypothetical protein